MNSRRKSLSQTSAIFYFTICLPDYKTSLRDSKPNITLIIFGSASIPSACKLHTNLWELYQCDLNICRYHPLLTHIIKLLLTKYMQFFISKIVIRGWDWSVLVHMMPVTQCYCILMFGQVFCLITKCYNESDASF